MAEFTFDVRLDMAWTFEVEAENEDDAYERLWDLIGYDAEDIVQVDYDPDSEYLDIEIRKIV